MPVSDFTIRLLLLFLPGILCFLIVTTVTTRRERSISLVVLYSFILGVACYFTYRPFAPIASWGLSWTGFGVPSRLVFLQALTDKKIILNYNEIFLVALWAIPVSFVTAAILNYNLVSRVAALCRVTNKFGELNVWEYTLNLREVQWAVVRDIKNNLAFEGWIEAYSDVDAPRELFLRDVSVFRNDTGEELYQVPPSTSRARLMN